jgi:stage II sporulation protein R
MLRKNIAKRMGMVLLCGCLAAGAAVQIVRQMQIQHTLAEEVLRFHVRANSNSVKDQALKLKVRDAVGGYLETLLSDADNLEQSKTVTEINLDEITRIASDTIKEAGASYDVSAAVTTEWFPQKQYADAVFPQGNYEALIINIGSGKGRNWWCVMYPNLCFQGTVYEKEANSEKLLEVLDEEEYEQVIQNKNYKVAFKYFGKH